MPNLTLIVPGPLETRTGGYNYDRRIASGLRERGWAVDVQELDRSFPQPTPHALEHAARVLAGIPDGTTVLIDGLAFGAMPVEVEREAARLRLAALVHLPLAAAVGMDRSLAVHLEASERRALASAAVVIVTGKATVQAVGRYGVSPDRIVLVEPGTDRASLAHSFGRPMPGFTPPSPVRLLTVAALTPGKGHDLLFRALANVPCRDWHLTCAGSLTRDESLVERLQARLRADRLEDRVSLAGELDEVALAACYDEADVFVLPTWHESYGMAVAEALARGLPVISTKTGAIPELIGADAADGPAAGLLVEPGDLDGLTDALSRVLGDPRLLVRLAEGARHARDRLPTWEAAFSRMAAALGDV